MKQFFFVLFCFAILDLKWSEIRIRLTFSIRIDFSSPERVFFFVSSFDTSSFLVPGNRFIRTEIKKQQQTKK